MPESPIRLPRADDALQTSEGRYRALFEYAPDGILIADANGSYIDANATMCAMLGYTHHELVHLKSEDIMVPSEIPHVASALIAIAGARDYRREWEFRRKDATTFCADVMATVMPDGNLMAFVRDNTQRNAATAAARAADQRLRFALSSALVGIWDMDYTTGVLHWSEEMDAQYGIAPGTFGGTLESFMERIHADDRAAVAATIAAASTTGSEFSVLHRVAHPDGKLRWLSGAGRFVLDSDGRPLRAIGISRDVTERHLLESQFQHAQKMEAVGRLAGGVAHDFNNLLTVILGNCEILLDGIGPGDERIVEIDQIHDASKRAAGLTRQLLAFSRKEIIEPKVLDLNAVIEQMRPMLARLIKEDVKLVFKGTSAPGLVTGDHGQLEQVVLNLAVNAQDAMPTGGTLTIEVANVDLDHDYAALHFDVQPGPYVALTVTDTGVGMPPGVIERLFEPFFTTKAAGRGTGLGLASVHGIVAAGGGSVRVYSEVGHGSSFKVYLPRVISGEVACDTPDTPAASATGTETVLIVDDAQGLREVTARLLTRQGYTVIAAANAIEAERLFDWNPQIALLLTDVVMPGGNGPDLARRLTERRPGLKVIYMSGYTDETIVQHGVLKPGIAFLHKPFTSSDLGRKLRETLDR